MTQENTENTEVETAQDDTGSQTETVEKTEEQTETDDTAEYFTVKVDGVEKKVTKDELLKDYQIKEASYQRLQKAEALKDEVKPYLSVVRALKKGDLSVLKELGLKREDVLNFSEKELKAYIEEQQLSPEQREAKEAKEERDALKREKEILLADQAAQKVEDEIIDAFKDAAIPLKGNPRLIRRVAENMYADLEAGYQPSAKKSLKRVQDTIDLEFKEYVERCLGKDADKFLDNLPTKLVDGIRKKGVKQVQSQMPSGRKSATTNKPKSPISDEFRDYMKAEFRKRG